MLNKKICIITLLSILSTPIQAANVGDYVGNAITKMTGKTPFYDKSNEYIINPNLPMFKEFEWTTWQDSLGGRMAHDPAWFKTPNEKYLTKEISFDWTKLKSKTALEKREAYFYYLCSTEAVGYLSSEHPKDILKAGNTNTATSTWFYPRKNAYPIKNMDKILNMKNPYKENTNEWENYKKNREQLLEKIMITAQQNPYINPDYGYGYYNWSEFTLNWSFSKMDSYQLKNFNPKNYPKENTFREYMDDYGQIYRIRYSATEQKFLPVIKVDKPEAKYYQIYREIEREDMKKLGIWGTETIDVEYKTGKILYYYKTFLVPAYLNSKQNENVDTPINWNHTISCTPPISTIDSVLN